MAAPGVRARPDRRHLHEIANAGGAGRLGHDTRAGGVDILEILSARHGQDAGQVDDGPGALHRVGHGVRVADVGLYGVHLPDASEGLQMQREIWPSHGDADAPASLQQRPHRMTADKPGPSEDRDEIRRGNRRFRLSRHRSRPCPT